MWTLSCILSYACVDRGAEPRCELGGSDELCGLQSCPEGFACDATREVCVADAAAP